MTIPDIQQAKEWARDNINGWHFTGSDRALAAARVIQSLPDHWIDAEKIEKLLTVWRSQLEECDHADGHTVMITCINDLAFEIATPSLPTLADMTPEEREACRWMRVELAGYLPGAVLVDPDSHGSEPMVMYRDGANFSVRHEDITPLPDLPKLEWPGSTHDDVAYATGGALTTQDVVDECRATRKERALPRPEDVPAGEPWIVEHYDHEWVGARDDSGTTNYPWALVKIDGTDYVLSQDVEVTLVSRLAPEVGA